MFLKGGWVGVVSTAKIYNPGSCDVKIKYQLDRRLHRFKTKTKVTKTTVIYLQYSDNCVIFAHSVEELQTTLNLFAKAYKSLGLSPQYRENQNPLPVCPW